MTDMTQNKPATSMPNHNNTISDQTKMLNKKIKETWSKLSDDDVKLYTTEPDQFFMKLKSVCHIEKADAEKQISGFKANTNDAEMHKNSNTSGKSTHAA